MKSTDTIIRLANKINEFQRRGNGDYYNLILDCIVKYLYDDFPLENLNLILRNSSSRILNLFSDAPDSNIERSCFDISDLFLTLQFLDNELSITSGMDKFCNIFRDKVTGKYEATRTKVETTYDNSNIAEVIMRVFTRFNSYNIYSPNQIDFERDNQGLISDRFPVTDKIHMLKPDFSVNRIYLDLLNFEVNPTQKKIWVLMTYSKIIGIIRAIFTLCEKNEMSEMSEYISNKKSCIYIFSEVVSTLEILNGIERGLSKNTHFYLQSELCDIIHTQFPYSLVDYKDCPNYWDYFQEYLHLFFKIKHLIGKQISCSMNEINHFLGTEHLSKFLNSFEFIFDRIFIFITSFEIKYFSTEASATNYISPFYAIVVNELYLFFRLNGSVCDKSYASLLSTIQQINFINLTKISFSCINNLFNTYNSKLTINHNLIIPENLSKVRFFHPNITGYELIYLGLRLIHHVFQNFEIDSFSPITEQIFNRLHITHYLFSIQNGENNANSPHSLCRLKSLLDEVTILFSKRIDRETLNRLLQCELSITSRNSLLTQRVTNREIERCLYII